MTTQQLIFPNPLFRQLLDSICQYHPQEIIRLLVGYRKSPEGCDWLVRDIIIGSDAQQYSPLNLISVEPITMETIHLFSNQTLGKLFYRHNKESLDFYGWVNVDNQQKTITSLFLLGPGMHQLILNQSSG